MELGAKIYYDTIKQIYGYDFEVLAKDLRGLGARNIFTPVLDNLGAKFESKQYPLVDAKPYLSELIKVMSAEQIKVTLVIQCFHDSYYYENFPEFRPIDQGGQPYKKRGWYRPLCPSHSLLRNNCLQLIEEVVNVLAPNGLALDFVRFPLFWEEISFYSRPEKMSEFCFCPECLKQFQQYSEITLPVDSDSEVRSRILKEFATPWEAWKIACLTNFVAQVRSLLRIIAPQTEVICHYIPLELLNLNSGRLLGQEPGRLRAHVDMLSPLLYHQVLGKEPSAVKVYLSQQRKKDLSRLYPSLQITDTFRRAGLRIWELEDLLKPVIEIKQIPGLCLFQYRALVEKDNDHIIKTPQYKVIQSLFAGHVS